MGCYFVSNKLADILTIGIRTGQPQVFFAHNCKA